jgi:hypothetical protein
VSHLQFLHDKNNLHIIPAGVEMFEGVFSSAFHVFCSINHDVVLPQSDQRTFLFNHDVVLTQSEQRTFFIQL